MKTGAREGQEREREGERASERERERVLGASMIPAAPVANNFAGHGSQRWPVNIHAVAAGLSLHLVTSFSSFVSSFLSESLSSMARGPKLFLLPWREPTCICTYKDTRVYTHVCVCVLERERPHTRYK
jgi:hypothetical protein